MEWPVKTYLMTNHANRDAAFYNTQKEAFINWFTYDRLEMSQTHQPFRRGGHRRMPPVVGEIAYANTYPQAIAYFGLGLDQQWLDPIYTSCDYTMSGNPLNMCFMANCGQHWLKEAMHDTYSNPLGVAKGIQSYHQMGSFGLLVSATNVVSAGTFGWTTLRPMWRNWPMHELVFENIHCAVSNEFTVGQTNAITAFSLAVLSDGGPTNVHVNPVESPQKIPAAMNGRGWNMSVTDAVRIEFNTPGRKAVSIVDLGGRELHRWTGTDAAHAVPAARLAQGIYLVKVSINGAVTSAPVSISGGCR